jgi:flagellar hook assembly protein FlgD
MGKASSSNSNSNASFAVRTDKKTYHLGEEIKIIIENNGSQPFRTSGLNFALLVVNPATNVKYQIINTTEPILVAAADAGASRTFPWNQSDARGNQVNPGNYTASAILGPLRANSSFSIS